MNLGKWEKHTCLLQNQELTSHLPETRLFSKKHFKRMIKKHQQVILKPDHGTCGMGIMLVCEYKKTKYVVHIRDVTECFPDRKTVLKFLKKRVEGNPYLIQQFIPFLEVNERPIDLRIMVQRRENEPWAVTGILVKLAKSGYKITNPEEKVLSVGEALYHTSLRDSYTSIIPKLKAMAIEVAKQLTTQYPELMVIGLDVLVDPQGKIWLIESNFSPMISWFANLSDKSSYKRILSYEKEGRYQQKWLKQIG